MADRTRGGCLTAFLVAMLVLNPLTSLYYIFAGEALRRAVPAFPSWAVPLFAVGSILNVVFALAVWRWQRWGVYGFLVTALLTFAINAIYVGILPGLLGVLGPVILCLLIRPHWAQMSPSTPATAG